MKSFIVIALLFLITSIGCAQAAVNLPNYTFGDSTTFRSGSVNSPIVIFFKDSTSNKWQIRKNEFNQLTFDCLVPGYVGGFMYMDTIFGGSVVFVSRTVHGGVSSFSDSLLTSKNVYVGTHLSVGTPTSAYTVDVSEPARYKNVLRMTTAGSTNNPTEIVHMRDAQTTGSTVTPIDTIAVSSNQALLIRADITALQVSSANAGGYKLDGLFSNAGTLDTVGTVARTFERESDAAWNCDIGVSGGNVIVYIIGKNATTVNWVAIIRYTLINAGGS